MVSQGRALARLWTDTFSLVEYREAEKPNGATGHVEATVLEGQPCKLSFSTLKETGQDDPATVAQAAVLFCGAALDIPAGSKIVVTRGGRAFEYGRSGDPGIFAHHQEVPLAPFRGWA